VKREDNRRRTRQEERVDAYPSLRQQLRQRLAHLEGCLDTVEYDRRRDTHTLDPNWEEQATVRQNDKVFDELAAAERQQASAIMGLNISRFLDPVEEMVHACSATVPVEENPGVVLGIILGVLANGGRDKVTIITSPGIWDFGAWLEQLLAESTGKDGKGLIPIDREPLGTPNVYGNDRMFAYMRLESAPDATQDAAEKAH
jgi:hypothetical protein